MQKARHFEAIPTGRRPGVTDTILETRGLTREFSGFVAVDGVNLRVATGGLNRQFGNAILVILARGDSPHQVL